MNHGLENKLLVLSGHQPDILPYPGFFYKMYYSNIMDICPYDPFSDHADRYHHRVKIGTDDKWEWFTLPIEAHDGYSIMQVKLKNHLMNERWNQLEKVYNRYPLWNEYKDDLYEIFMSHYEYMWELNLRLILWLRDLLNIKTYISISWKAKGSDTAERIAYQFSNYGPVIYLAGKGSAQYMDIKKYEKLTKAKVAIITYTPPKPYSTVSILTPLLTYSHRNVLRALNIDDKPIKVIINGKEENLEIKKQNQIDLVKT